MSLTRATSPVASSVGRPEPSSGAAIHGGMGEEGGGGWSEGEGWSGEEPDTLKVPRPNVLLAVSLSLPGAQKAFTSSRASGGCGPSHVVSLGSLFYALGVVRALSVHLWILTSAGQDGRNAPKQLCRFAMFCSPAPCVAGNSAARRRHSLHASHARSKIDSCDRSEELTKPKYSSPPRRRWRGIRPLVYIPESRRAS